MSTHPDTRLEELWADLPVGTPPLDDIVRNGAARRRRHRLAVVGGTVALILATIAGISVGSDLLTRQGSGPDDSLTAAPTTHAGTRLVGMNRVVVAVPEGWPTGPLVDDCGLPVEDGVLFAHEAVGFECDISRNSSVVSVRFSPLDSEEGRQASQLATTSTIVNGTQVRTGEVECAAAADCFYPNGIPTYVVVPSQDVAITITGPPTDRGVVDDIAASLQILDTGWTTVPFVKRGTFADWRTALTDNSLMPDVVENTCPNGQPCGYYPHPQQVAATEPAAGEVVAEGSTVTVYGPGAAPVVEPLDSGPSVPKRLDCPGDAVVTTDGGLLDADATLHGSETPEQAVEAFLPAIGLAGHQYVVDVPEAWVLRPDGTAVARLDFLISDGWMVHGYDRCLRSGPPTSGH